MEHGWGINGPEQPSEDCDLKAPLSLQNRSLTAQGCLRVIRDEDESAWGRKYLKLRKRQQVGGSTSTYCSRLVDPTFIPEVEESPELMRTTLVKGEVDGLFLNFVKV